jgi:alkylhydroperoxidase family enzyme
MNNLKGDSQEETRSASADAPFLPPIENPQDPFLKQVYIAQERMFGKVIAPIKVHSARLPAGFIQFYGKLNELDSELQLPSETRLLIRERVARLNICLFCIAANRAYTIRGSMNQAKFDELEQYKTSPLFSEAERAALDYVTELTSEKKVSPNTFARLSVYYSERKICEIVWLVASEHLNNITNLGLNIHSDMLCEITRKAK